MPDTRSPLPAPRSDPAEGWTTVITPHRGWLDWRLKQLWRYRDLISLFVWRDYVSAYKQTILGPLWHVIQPLLTTITFTVIFGKIAKLPTNGIPPFLFYLAGTVSWSYFANNLNKTSSTFVGNASLLGKVYFHRLVIPVSIAFSNLISFSIQLGIFLVFLGIFYVRGLTSHPASVPDPVGFVMSSNAMTTVAGAPGINLQPTNASVVPGSNAVFNPVVSGTGSLSYQWYFQTNALADGTNASYTVASAQGSNAGSYFLVVRNAAGTVASRPATLTVLTPSIHLTGWIFCMPLFLLMLAGYGLGGGIIVSALTTRYRDLTNLVGFGVQLLMYATPVILPVSAMGKYSWVAEINPLTPIIEGFRLAFLGAGSVDALQLGISFGVMLVVLAVGLMLFTHVERTFMDTV
jgi:ABC-type polysaccharide/polyol phosphate export permease